MIIENKKKNKVTVLSVWCIIKKEFMLKKMLYAILLMPMFVVAQHTIKGTFSPAEDFEYAILYKVTPTTSLYVANTQVDKKGNFEFQLDSTITKGMYRLVYAVPQEEFNFDIIYNAKEDVSLTFNTETGVKYNTSVENTLINSYTTSMSMVSQSIGNFYRQQSTDTLALAAIFKTQKETQVEYGKAAEGTIALHFIKANSPYIPEGFEDISTYIKNLKAHFFDHVDFDNEILQSSNFLIERSLNYVFGMTSKEDNEVISYEKNIDEVYAAMKDANPVIKSTLLEILWQQMVDANFEAVANYIADTYLIEIAQTLNDIELVDGLTLFKSLSIGNKAPEFNVDLGEGVNKTEVSLYDLDMAQEYVVVFWSSTCSHCLNEIPKLQTYIKSMSEGKVKVIAVGLEDETTLSLWEKAIVNYPEFIHVLGFGKWNNEIGNSYNVTATPTYYILNANKKIIAKPYDFEAFKKYMDQK